MIEKEMRGDIRQGDREKALLNALRKIKGERVRLNSGTTPPHNLVDFLKVSLQVQSLSPEERESLQFMLDEIDKAGKK